MASNADQSNIDEFEHRKRQFLKNKYIRQQGINLMHRSMFNNTRQSSAMLLADST